MTTKGLRTCRKNLYKLPGGKEIEWAANGGVIRTEWVPVEKYAQQVVKNALKTKPNLYQWLGSSSSIIWFFSTFFWHTIFVSVPYRPFLAIANPKQDFAVPLIFKFPDFKNVPKR